MTILMKDPLSLIDLNNIQKLVIQSNNNLFELRKKITELGYSIEKEKIVYDNNKFYTIIEFNVKNKKYKKNILKYGNNVIIDDDYLKYIKYLIHKNNEIIKKLNYKHIVKKVGLLIENYKLKKHI